MEELEFFDETDNFDLPKPPTKVEEKPVKEPEKEERTELTDEERDLFRDLLTIGKISKTFDVLGHQVTLQTITVRDELNVGIATKEHFNTSSFARSYQSAIVAASVVTINGNPLYVPLSADESPSYIFNRKLEKVQGMYPIVVSAIYDKYAEVEKEFAGLAKKLGKLDG